MKLHTKAYNLNPEGKPLPVEIESPHFCPRCKVAFGQTPVTSYVFTPHTARIPNNSVYSLYFCPYCEKCFLVEYYVVCESRTPNVYETQYTAIYPTPAIETDFSDDIRSLSPDFVKIYHQSESAENSGLSDICGLGYRKALEFLVKDYAIAFNPQDADKIKNLMLSPCIKEYIDNPRIKTLATASTWLGNDETHYVRKHSGYNLETLKAFISAMVSFIDSDFSYRKAEKLLNSPK